MSAEAAMCRWRTVSPAGSVHRDPSVTRIARPAINGKVRRGPAPGGLPEPVSIQSMSMTIGRWTLQQSFLEASNSPCLNLLVPNTEKRVTQNPVGPEQHIPEPSRFCEREFEAKSFNSGRY